ncbi:PEP-CTERM sorting domain-containing protein [Okeania sp.]|uniref:PEP-CTERM sorting domain-containing protein n=1 Tax=Okeania sp. TaxID=3100323 RepID=UPI002B4B94AF|nr:PEP-CTERM sorting domain-containing protein [Okeania sp.]MEB3341656.1 PEP-CTERM sorting domain-containing protein [Okeania sp.]
MKNIILASLATIPFALGTVFTGVANAASFGEFQIGGGTLIDMSSPTPQVTSTTVNLNGVLGDNPELNFNQGLIGIVGGDGIFTGFDTANIQDIEEFDVSFTPDGPLFTSNVAIDNFIDFGVSTFGAPGVSAPNNTTITDGLNVFNLSKASYKTSQSGANVSIDVALYGDFIFGANTYKGKGNLTFQTNNTTKAAVDALLQGDGSLENMTFSGAMFTVSTPEPTVLLGLGVVGAGLVVTRRKKASK